MSSKEQVYAMINTLYEADLLPTSNGYESAKRNYEIAENVIKGYNERLDKLKSK